MSNGLLLSDEKKVNNELENLDDYSYASGKGLFGGTIKGFIGSVGDRLKAGGEAKKLEAQANLGLSQAANIKASQPQKQGMTPLQIVGVVAGSLMAITVMVVVIKRVKARRG